MRTDTRMQFGMRQHFPFVVILLLSFLLLFLLSGCGSSSRSDNIRPPSSPPAPAAKTAPAAMSTNAGGGGKSVEVSRKIIETGQLTLETRNLIAAESKIFQLLEKQQGIIESSNVSLDSNGRRNGNYSLRIPAGKLNDFINEVAALSDIVVRQRSISSQDVTEEYIDISARLENMQRHETRLREILARANSVDEILKVEKELATVRGQIESTTGRLKALTGKIDMSTLKLRINEVVMVTETNFGGKLMAVVRDSWVGAGDVVLYLVAAVIVLSPLGLIIILAVWWWKRRQKAKNMAVVEYDPSKDNERERT